jgi:hypothetical protein
MFKLDPAYYQKPADPAATPKARAGGAQSARGRRVIPIVLEGSLQDRLDNLEVVAGNRAGGEKT